MTKPRYFCRQKKINRDPDAYKQQHVEYKLKCLKQRETKEKINGKEQQSGESKRDKKKAIAENNNNHQQNKNVLTQK